MHDETRRVSPLRMTQSGKNVALLRSLLNQANTAANHPHGIVALTEADLPALRLHLHSRLREEEVFQAVRQLPGLSQWHPQSGEYILVTPWRHREDIISLREVSAFHHESELVAAVFAAADQKGLAACITAETYEKRRPIFYTRNGMELFETIIAYHHERVVDFMDIIESPAQEFVPVTLDDPALLEQVMEVDHAAFPWLWRNLPGEFHWWMSQPSVEVWAGIIDGEVASYYGTTLFQQLGHIDRIAVHPKYQGQRLGAETLHASLQRMARMGLQKAALSTQLGNPVSQRLYERTGFRRSAKDDYQMYGTLLSAAPDEAEQT